MGKALEDRMAAKIEGDFVVFLIGMRINKPWKINKWLPAFLAMPKMIKELQRLPKEETGFLGHTAMGPGVLVQYWRSFDHLEAYARSKEHNHFPAWIEYNKRVKGSHGDVGIWHETYLVKAGQYEAIYIGMPPHGLGRVSELVPATGNRNEARQRLHA